MSGESNVTSGAPGSPSHHRHHKKIGFGDILKWINPVGEAIREKADRDAKQRDAEDATYQAELKGGVNDDAVLYVAGDDWDGHETYRKLIDRIYGPGIAPNEYRPHVLVMHPEIGSAVAAVMQRPGFWNDVCTELNGGRKCAGTQALNVFDDIRKGLTKAADKLDHAEDRALGIGG